MLVKNKRNINSFIIKFGLFFSILPSAYIVSFKEIAKQNKINSLNGSFSTPVHKRP